MNLATRISRISVSKTMAVMEAAIKLRDQGIDVVDFGPGEPDFPTPENVKQAGIRAIQADFTKYTAIGGIKELKKAIVDKHAREFGSKYDISECVVNIGGKHAIFNIFAAVVDEGDDVIIPTPYWVTFADIARFVNSNPIFVPTKESDGFRLTAQILERALTPKTRLVVVNSQSHSTSNPTSISQKAALEALTGPQESVGVMLAEYARRRKFVLDRLRAIPGVKCAEPGGAFYAYPNISVVFGRGGIKDSVDFSARLLEKAHVAVTPGEAFGTNDHVRMSYATSMEQLDKGLKRIHEFITRL